MTFLFTILYAVLGHLSMAELLPDLAPYRIMLWLGVITGAGVMVRLVLRPALFRLPQMYLMLGLTTAVPLSRMAHLWFGGAWPALSAFLVSGIVFFFVVATVDAIQKMKILIGALVLTGIYLLSQSLYGYHVDGDDSHFVITQRVDDANGQVTQEFPRLRSTGFLEDPNDFAQYLLVTICLLGLAWRPQRLVRNLLFVLPVAGYLLYGVYATQSRGALFGVAVLVFLAFESRLSRKTSAALAAVALAGLIVFQAAGPREISLTEGSAAGRVEAWGTGLGMLKSSPLFGAGYDLFLDYHERTAHNSFVLCFAELGLIGYLLWMGLIVYTVIDLNAVVRSEETAEKAPEVVRCARVIRAALLTFLATSWFLSRTYIITFYLLIGMGVAVRYLLENEEVAAEGREQPRWLWTTAAAAASMMVVYVTVRLKNL